MGVRKPGVWLPFLCPPEGCLMHYNPILLLVKFNLPALKLKKWNIKNRDLFILSEDGYDAL